MKTPSKMLAIRNTTTTATLAYHALKDARNAEVKLIGEGLLTALANQTEAIIDRQRDIIERTAEGGKKKLKQSPASISTKLRKVLLAAIPALKAAGTARAIKAAKDIEAGLARSLELYQARQAFIATR
jgi:seryl-tRNA(Sec) selenium transferase